MGTALVIDDSRAMRMILGRMLNRFGYEVCSAANGREALNMISAQSLDLSVILVDRYMPEMNGLEASFEFRSHEGLMLQYRSGAQSSKLKIIAMSADFNEALIKEVMKAGFDGFLAKPLTLSGFRDLKLRPSLLRNASCRNNVM